MILCEKLSYNYDYHQMPIFIKLSSKANQPLQFSMHDSLPSSKKSHTPFQIWFLTSMVFSDSLSTNVSTAACTSLVQVFALDRQFGVLCVRVQLIFIPLFVISISANLLDRSSFSSWQHCLQLKNFKMYNE